LEHNINFEIAVIELVGKGLNFINLLAFLLKETENSIFRYNR